MLAVSTLFLGLRIYCKAVRVRWMVWVDDYLLLAGWAFLVVSSGLLSRLVHLGFGKTLTMTPTMSTVLYCADNTHKLALALTKTSFAVTLLRIATGWQIYLIWFLVVSMNIQFLVHIILTWRAICPRVPGDTTPHLPGTCWEAHEAITLGIFGGLHFVLALLPWKIVMGLQMRKREKIGVAVAMSTGVLAVGSLVASTTQDERDEYQRRQEMMATRKEKERRQTKDHKRVQFSPNPTPKPDAPRHPRSPPSIARHVS
ncbi:hypothetical protein HYQ45_018797 [Verticillium longisporum]|uniref:Rhodopsin domain-containing protein n=1 Tax=Verticillium longisporum TaxID=100787 RepID=A0A8I3AWD8_VERLO|nr:hypothetical protein HYQ45_018797 [Verticillium longisporum]